MQYDHQECPHCGKKGCYSFNTEKNVYRCFSCNKSGKLNQDVKYEKEEGLTLEPYIPEEYRGIKKATMEKCGVYFTKRPVGNDYVETVHYTYPHATKHRDLPKSITCSGKLDAFYGQDDYPNGGKTLTITEGEEDRLSVIQMMGDWPTVSVPNASPSKDFWANAQEFLGNFDKIVLSVDTDAPGDALAEKIYRMFPGKVYRVDHGKYKDANEFLKNGAEGDYKKSWWNAQKVKPDNILSSYQDFLDLYENTPDYEYFPTGIDDLDDKMLGIHKGAVTMILAPTGIGKTEFMRYLEWKALSETDYTIAICHLEETQLRSILGLVSYDLMDNLTRKDLIEEKAYDEQVRKSLQNLTESERLYQFSVRSDDDIDDLISNIRFLVTAMGVDYVFFEPIQDIVHGTPTEKESLLTDLVNKMKLLAPEIDVGIVFIAHANEEGNPKYCNSLVQGAAYEIVLSRDVDAEDKAERNTMYVSVGRKNRTGGGSGPAGSLSFDKNTYMLTPNLGPVEPKTHEHNKAVGF